MKQTLSYLTSFLIGAGVGAYVFMVLVAIIGVATPGDEPLILPPLATAILWALGVGVGGVAALKIRHRRPCKKVQSCSSDCSKGSTGCCG